MLACAAPAVDSGAPPFTPTFGAWEADVGGTWEGDCALADSQTHQPPKQAWIVGAYRYGFSVRDVEGYWYGCAMDGQAFTCELPVIADDFTSLGLDVHATYTPAWEGEFDSSSSLSGEYRVAAECTGADCDQLTGYGADFSFPCVAWTALSAVVVP